VRNDQIALLREIGIQDSKAITDAKIKELSRYLIEMDIPYSLMILHNEKYNKLQRQGWSQGKMKAMLHDACIKNVLGKIGDAPLAGILIDQFCMPDIYKRHIASEGKTLDADTFFMTKAESYSIAVAAGSVIARASFVREMDKLADVAGVPLLKGASGKVDQLAARIIRDKGVGVLEKIAKVHFANTGKAKRLG
jgi:ribonuclease HIII